MRMRGCAAVRKEPGLAKRVGDFFRRHGKITFYIVAIAVEAAAATVIATRGGTLNTSASLVIFAALIGTAAKGAREVAREVGKSEKKVRKLLKFIEHWAPPLLGQLARLLAVKDPNEYEKQLSSLHTDVLVHCTSLVEGTDVRTALYEMKGQQFCPIPYSRGWDPSLPPTFAFDTGDGLRMKEILSESTKIYTSDLTQERNRDVLLFSFDGAYQSLVCVTISVGNTVKGFLHLEGKAKGAVDASVSGAVENMALIIASAWSAKP